MAGAEVGLPDGVEVLDCEDFVAGICVGLTGASGRGCSFHLHAVFSVRLKINRQKKGILFKDITI